ncbi:response regulator [Couchioplanes caeruleus]|uniref:Response regulatory domain-containing protein n=1 Tax=Couchioplanes caeruleus subsp. caeruleus TaxID=56427 RepID=A0A1K0FMR5_9ACTN|nr:response regulator [Couchioplanes caeruleus]OJF14125.1 hypothetical protein BG844_11450 [Couchioplanes caeruleus subsp. caeruleus]
MPTTATVLIGEYDDDVRDAFARLFRRAGYQVLTASDPLSVLDTASREQPDMVVLNLRDDDGPNACRALRADGRTQATRILMLTADLYPDADAAAAAGADAYMAKPMNNDDLLHQVRRLLTVETGRG